MGQPILNKFSNDMKILNTVTSITHNFVRIFSLYEEGEKDAIFKKFLWGRGCIYSVIKT